MLYEVITDAVGSLVIHALDSSEINSLAVGVSGTGAVAGGGALAANVITNAVTTEISAADVSAGGSIAMDAITEAIIRTLSVGA